MFEIYLSLASRSYRDSPVSAHASVVFTAPTKMEKNENLARRQISCVKSPSGEMTCTPPPPIQ
ncbi:4709_t:CDS:2, partial [Funneliformis caledonium]